jgi:membrane protein
MKLKIEDKDIIRFLDKFKIKSKKIRGTIAAVEGIFIRLDTHHTFLIAAGIAFNILLYIIPLMLVALYIVNITVSQEDISFFLVENLHKIIPSIPMLSDYVTSIISEVNVIYEKSLLFGWIGIVTLIWLSSTLLSSLRTGLNMVYHIQMPKTYFFYKIQDIFLIFAIAILILIMSFVSPIIAITQQFIVQFLPEQIAGIFSTLYVFGFSMLNSLVLLYLLYRFVPNQKMPRSVRYISIISCLIFIETSRHIFGWYLSGLSSYGKFYGTYAIIASMAVWVYYLTFIILFSAELGKYIYDILYGETIKNYLRTLKVFPKSKITPK